MYNLFRNFGTLSKESDLYASVLSWTDVEYSAIDDIVWIPDYKTPESQQEGIVNELQTENRRFLA